MAARRPDVAGPETQLRQKNSRFVVPCVELVPALRGRQRFAIEAVRHRAAGRPARNVGVVTALGRLAVFLRRHQVIVTLQCHLGLKDVGAGVGIVRFAGRDGRGADGDQRARQCCKPSSSIMHSVVRNDRLYRDKEVADQFAYHTHSEALECLPGRNA